MPGAPEGCTLSWYSPLRLHVGVYGRFRPHGKYNNAWCAPEAASLEMRPMILGLDVDIALTL
jgi:hypothetical protein